MKAPRLVIAVAAGLIAVSSPISAQFSEACRSEKDLLTNMILGGAKDIVRSSIPV